MAQRDRDYFLQRAEAELELAQAGTHEAVVRAHYVLAGIYLDRVYGPDVITSPTADEAMHTETN